MCSACLRRMRAGGSVARSPVDGWHWPPKRRLNPRSLLAHHPVALARAFTFGFVGVRAPFQQKALFNARQLRLAMYASILLFAFLLDCQLCPPCLFALWRLFRPHKAEEIAPLFCRRLNLKRAERAPALAPFWRRVAAKQIQRHSARYVCIIWFNGFFSGYLASESVRKIRPYICKCLFQKQRKLLFIIKTKLRSEIDARTVAIHLNTLRRFRRLIGIH